MTTGSNQTVVERVEHRDESARRARRAFAVKLELALISRLLHLSGSRTRTGAPSDCARTGEEGRSILEVSMVCMVIAIICAFALPSVASAIRAYNLRSAAEIVAEKLSAGRALAMTQNKNVTISFVPASGTYGFDFSTPGTPPTLDPDGVPDNADPSAPDVGYTIDTLPSGVSISSVTGAVDLPGGKGVTYTSRGEQPIAASQVDIKLTNGRGDMTVSVNLRGQVWVH